MLSDIERRALVQRRGRLLALIAGVTVAVVLLVVTKSGESQSTRDFDYTLPVNPYVLDDTQLNKVLDEAKGAGVKTIFSGAVWSYMTEGNPSTARRPYDWSGLDRLVGGAQARGMKVRLQLSQTPDWVHPDLRNTVPAHSQRVYYPPRGGTELGYWSGFVRDVVSRYKGRVESYEVWNEPNISDFWKPGPDPAEYAALLRAGYLTAKSADPNATVLFGGLNRNDVGYLDAYYSEAGKYPEAAGEKYFFDVMDAHPYSSMRSPDGGPEEPMSPDRNTPEAIYDGYFSNFGKVDYNFLGLEKVKEAMDAQGDTGKSVFVGEYGFSTADTWMKAVPDWRRALYLKRAYVLARALPYVEGMSWYAYHPNPGDSPEWTILKEDLSETMTFRALRQVSGAEAGGATVALSTPDTPVSGTYRVSPATTDLETPANWDLYVDGVPQGAVYGQVPIDWDTTKVADGKHTLMLTAYPRQGSQSGSVWPSNVVTVYVNNTAPVVTGMNSANGATGIGTSITATLSKDTNPSAFTASTAQLFKGTNTRLGPP